jgi:hypothetical protein
VLVPLLLSLLLKPEIVLRQLRRLT